MAVSEVDLDYSVASLAQVDEVIEGIRSDGPPVEAVAETLFGFGAYAGEVLVRHADAQWVDFDDSARQVFGHAFDVATTAGQLRNPLGKAFARYVNGAEASLYYFCRTVIRSLIGSSQGRGHFFAGGGGAGPRWTRPRRSERRQPAQTSASSAGTVVARPSSLRAATALFGSRPVKAGS